MIDSICIGELVGDSGTSGAVEISAVLNCGSEFKESICVVKPTSELTLNKSVIVASISVTQ